MASNRSILQAWRQLYDAAGRLKDLAPWQWMTEADVFGVQHPETGDLGFVSIMGMLGEHYAVTVYLGAEGLEQFWALQQAGPSGDPERVLEIPQLQASFENRDMLRKQDHALIKQLGLKFRGRQAWPLFRSFRPGFVPWFLEPDEVQFLSLILEQASEVTVRQQDHAALLPPPDEGRYLIRVLGQAGERLVWEDSIQQIAAPEPKPIAISVDIEMLSALKRLPPQRRTLEVDLFMAPSGVQEKGARPFYPYILLIVEARSGYILATDMLSPEPSLEMMWGEVPQRVLSHLAQAEWVPKTIQVRSPLLVGLLSPIAEELDIQLKPSRTLPGLDAVREFLLERFM